MVEECYVTDGLLEGLLAMAAAREPDSVSTLLAVTRAGDLEIHGSTTGGAAATGADDASADAADGGSVGERRDGASTGAANDGGVGDHPDAHGPGKRADDGSVVAPDTPVFTDFYLPSEDRSVDAVFGVDVSIPHGQAQGRFVSHPLGELSVSTTDDLHEVVLVAVPPWTRADVAAFDRSGRRLPLTILSAVPPEQPFDG